MIEIENLIFSYPDGEFRMDLPAFRVERGSLTALRGVSGGGKTTLLNLTAGILRPSAGSIRIDGIELSDLNEKERRRFRLDRIGSVFQDFELLEYLSVYDNIRLSTLLGGSEGETDRRVRLLADRAGIGRHLKRFPSHLSKGEQQRAALCRALLPEPELILADEATGNLDPSNKSHIWDLIKEYCLETGATVLAATHDPTLSSYFDAEASLEELLG